ncbi:MAG: pilus assembly protein PilM [Actinobacteria bacterium]|nr:pilus assembly protein PilM [Actinomycetota bacterium]
MKLSSRKRPENPIGVDLDVDSVAIAATPAGAALVSGVQPMPEGAVDGGEIIDVDAVSSALRDLFSRDNYPKRVRLAVASQGVAFRTIRLPLIENQDQLKAAVRFQAQEQIPMPLDTAVLDHQVIGAAVTEEGGRQIDVAVVAARRQSVDALLQAARGAGLEPVGIDLAAFGMIRALAAPAQGADEPAPDGYVPATVYCSLGGLTNLAIARGFACLFSRVTQVSVRGIAEELAASTGLTLEHAEQWLIFVGTDAPLEQVGGDPATAAAARVALDANLDRLADEIRLSLDYYGAQEDAAPVGDVVLCGWGSAIPGLPDRLGAVLGRQVSVRRPAALRGLSEAEAARLTLPYGLSLER